MTIATTRGALLRGGTEDAYGDEVDDNSTPVAGWEDFSLSIIERNKNEFDPATNTWRTVRYYSTRLYRSDIPIEYGDRIRDLRDGTVYAVDSITRAPRSLSGRASTTLKLRRM